jgi:transposase-like protein
MSTSLEALALDVVRAKKNATSKIRPRLPDELKRRIVEATGEFGLAHTSRKLGLNPKVVSNWKHRFAENDQRSLALKRPLIQVTRVQALQAAMPPPSATLQLGQARFDIFSESLALSLVAQQLERLQ